ncbi:hypothetical protein NPIL_82611 [Nephila pilipes]|uniref:Uncharacterized protein n=1 Tax=Nephila pilipes TaxID=299642 RepID=A0A8X6TWR4_NEPPI|nr:hypothetical protein NPIL_82611 [Nephila pilipes]
MSTRAAFLCHLLQLAGRLSRPNSGSPRQSLSPTDVHAEEIEKCWSGTCRSVQEFAENLKIIDGSELALVVLLKKPAEHITNIMLCIMLLPTIKHLASARVFESMEQPELLRRHTMIMQRRRSSAISSVVPQLTSGKHSRRIITINRAPHYDIQAAAGRILKAKCQLTSVADAGAARSGSTSKNHSSSVGQNNIIKSLIAGVSVSTSKAVMLPVLFIQDKLNQVGAAIIPFICRLPELSCDL